MMKMMKMMNENKFPRGWYTFIYPDGEVLVPLSLIEESESNDSDEEDKIEYLH